MDITIPVIMVFAAIMAHDALGKGYRKWFAVWVACGVIGVLAMLVP